MSAFAVSLLTSHFNETVSLSLIDLSVVIKASLEEWLEHMSSDEDLLAVGEACHRRRNLLAAACFFALLISERTSRIFKSSSSKLFEHTPQVHRCRHRNVCDVHADNAGSNSFPSEPFRRGQRLLCLSSCGVSWLIRLVWTL